MSCDAGKEKSETYKLYDQATLTVRYTAQISGTTCIDRHRQSQTATHIPRTVIYFVL